MYLKIEYVLLEAKCFTQEEKIILSYVAGLSERKLVFFGYANFFEKWGIEKNKAALILNHLVKEGICYQDSEGKITFGGWEGLKIFINSKR